jgi:hypothetical protein
MEWRVEEKFEELKLERSEKSRRVDRSRINERPALQGTND